MYYPLLFFLIPGNHIITSTEHFVTMIDVTAATPKTQLHVV